MASDSDKTSLIKLPSEFFPVEEDEKISYDLEYPLTSFTDNQSEMTQSLFSSESDHMPKEDYIQRLKTNDLDINTIRQESISSILQFSRNFDDPSLPYLAVNYLDRFISFQELPSGKSWMPKLIAVSCFSLAAKLKLLDELFKLTDLQRHGVIFDVENIKRMEYLILGALKWRIHSITPFSFLCFFISLFNLDDDLPLKQAASEIIFKTQTEINLVEFKPSIISASAILTASQELFPSQFSCFRDQISSSISVNKNRLVHCCDLMNSILMKTNKTESDISLIPLVNQLDLNQDEENTTTTTSSNYSVVSQTSSGDSTMVEHERDDDNNKSESDISSTLISLVNQLNLDQDEKTTTTSDYSASEDYTGTCLIALKHQTCIIFAIDSLGSPFDGSLGKSCEKLKELSYGSKPLYSLLAGGRKTLEDAVKHVLNKHRQNQYNNGSRMKVGATTKYAAKLWSTEKKYRQPKRRSCLVVGAYDGGRLELWAAINGIEGSKATQINEDAYFAGTDSDAARPFFSTYTRKTDLNTAIRWIEEGMVAASERPKSHTGGEIKILKILPTNEMQMIRSDDVAILKQEMDARLNLQE